MKIYVAMFSALELNAVPTFLFKMISESKFQKNQFTIVVNQTKQNKGRKKT